MLISAWLNLLLAIPVLLAGEAIVRRVRLLSWFNIPAPIVGGLLVSVVFLLGNITGSFSAKFQTAVSAQFWTWLVTPEPEWLRAPAKNANLPFLVIFFTCVGLNASWLMARRAGVQVVIFLGISVVLAVCQNFLGLGLASALGVSPLLGLTCGSLSLVGGHGTALGFAPELAKAGLQGASVLGAAAATYGIVAGALLGGPVGGALIRRLGLRPSEAEAQLHAGAAHAPGILSDMRALKGFGITFLGHLALVLLCVKAGAWVSFFFQRLGASFPVYMGAMLLAVIARNVIDHRSAWVRTEVVDTLGSVSLGWFLSMAMMTLNLAELAHAALAMLVILAAQTVLAASFAWFVTFKLMGGDFDAAVMAGGQIGFGLGATANAIASMKSLVENFGPAPRAFLVVPIVGSFLVDLFNAVNITVFLNLAR